MPAADTSTLISFLAGEAGPDIDALAAALHAGEVKIPPVVVTEILTTPRSRPTVDELLKAVEVLPILDGYWRRAALSRGSVRAKGLRARLADSLIAQSCIDHDIALITRDTDFRHFARHCGLKLA